MDQADKRPPVVIDDAIIALDRALSGLGEFEVPPAAKERGWASLQRELERRPVHRAAPTTQVTRRSRVKGLRWALGSAAAAVAVAATLIGTLAGGTVQTVDNGGLPTTVPSVVSSETTLPSTTVSTDGVVDTTVTPSDPSTTEGSSTTGGTEPGTSTTSGSNTGTTSGSSGGNPTTTQPTSPSTTSGQQNAAAQLVGSAKAAALYLAELVITGNTSGARAIVAPEAQSSLVQMMTSLEEPYGYTYTGAKAVSGTNVVYITLTVNDRIVDGQGEVLETVKSFAVKVRVDDAGAVIIAINAGS